MHFPYNEMLSIKNENKISKEIIFSKIFSYMYTNFECISIEFKDRCIQKKFVKFVGRTLQIELYFSYNKENFYT